MSLDPNLEPPASPPSPQLLFIVGMWRSGTSLIHALLNRHPQIALMYEAELLDIWPPGSIGLPTRNWPRRLEYYNQTFTRHRLSEGLLASQRPGREAALALYGEFARARGAMIIGEKAPAYYGRLPMLGRLFPDARFLIIWRDPIECCRSACRAGRTNRFFAQRGMMTRMLLGCETLAKGVEWLRGRRRRVHEVVYDDLVKNTEAELRRVCQFLAVGFVPAMLDLKAADVSNVPEGEHHAGVRSGVIGKGVQGDEGLPPAFAAKGCRYARLWRDRFSDLGFARTLAAGAESAAPRIFERMADRCRKSFWSSLDSVKRFLFRIIPLPCWRWLRSLTPRANYIQTDFASGNHKASSKRSTHL